MEGPPEVRAEVVARHAEQFDEELPLRAAGSQQEFVASSYITGHLQQAGYVVRLEPVPVADTVRSTLVIAVPPGEEEAAADAIVAVPYDTVEGLPPQGEDIGLFLELARALHVAAPGHSVHFVALGAEHGGGGGHLGSARLAELLGEEEAPEVITPVVVEGSGFDAPGAAGDRLRAIALEMDLPRARTFGDPAMPSFLRMTEVFARADIPHTVAAGGVEELGLVLLDYLADL